MEQTAEGQAEAAFGIGSVLFALVFVVLLVIPYWKIWQRTGHSGAWGLLMLVPLANIISLWWLAFKQWPALPAR